MAAVAVLVSSRVGTANSRAREAIWPEMEPASVTMAWALGITMTNLGEECRATNTAPSGKRKQILVGVHVKGRAAAHPGEGHRPAGQQQGVAGHRRHGLQSARGRRLEAQGPALQDQESTVAGQGPLHILGAAVVLLQPNPVARQGLDLLRVEAGLRLQRPAAPGFPGGPHRAWPPTAPVWPRPPWPGSAAPGPCPPGRCRG